MLPRSPCLLEIPVLAGQRDTDPSKTLLNWTQTHVLTLTYLPFSHHP